METMGRGALRRLSSFLLPLLLTLVAAVGLGAGGFAGASSHHAVHTAPPAPATGIGADLDSAAGQAPDAHPSAGTGFASPSDVDASCAEAGLVRRTAEGCPARRLPDRTGTLATQHAAGIFGPRAPPAI
ncbi:hypothetical protein [Actinoplanes sp. NPDC049802]|uniref:hypothetical protein n=1 Tax=Actinoplanes sp. NPDC049802 TaxID=3154742 RepID=UPI00340E6A48